MQLVYVKQSTILGGCWAYWGGFGVDVKVGVAILSLALLSFSFGAVVVVVDVKLLLGWYLDIFQQSRVTFEIKIK